LRRPPVSGPQLGQLATGLRCLALALGHGPTADGEAGLASADGPDLDGLGEPLEEALQSLSGRTAGSADLDCFQDDAPASSR
jgi:hypothetical protein